MIKNPYSKKDIAMQVICVHCKREQYGLAVYNVSINNAPCAWCGKTSKVLTEFDYRLLLNKPKDD